MFLQCFLETPRGSPLSLEGIGLARGGSSRLADTDKVITGRAHSNCSFLLSEHLHNYITARRGIAPDTDLAICRAGVQVCELKSIHIHTRITWHGSASGVYCGRNFTMFVRSWLSMWHLNLLVHFIVHIKKVHCLLLRHGFAVFWSLRWPNLHYLLFGVLIPVVYLLYG